MRLATKIILAFALLLVSALAAAFFFASRTVAPGVRGAMLQGGMFPANRLARELSAYYRGHQSWQGVESVIVSSDPSPTGGGQRVILLNTDNQVIADNANLLTGQNYLPPAASDVMPVFDGPATIGRLVFIGAPASAPEDPVLSAVNRAMILATIVAGGVGLGLALILIQSLTAPLRRLTDAMRRFARGERNLQLPAPGKDEVGDLTKTFQTMMAEIEKGESLRKEMTADIAHELRTPLSVMRANLEALADGVYPLAPENLVPLQDGVHLLTRLVEDLRTLALADGGQLALDKTAVDVAALIRRAADRFAPQAEQQSVRITVSAPGALPEIQGDPQRLSQVFGNLLHNALQVTPPDGEIRLGAEAEGKGVRITVEDSGPGIPAAHMEDIFERFYRLDQGRGRVDGGSGLGLAIARKLIEAHGGTISAENRPEGGARLVIHLPG